MSCYNSNRLNSYDNKCVSDNRSYNCMNTKEKYPIGMAYVPWQEWKNVMCAKEGMGYGTIFSDLVLPFYGCRNGGRG